MKRWRAWLVLLAAAAPASAALTRVALPVGAPAFAAPAAAVAALPALPASFLSPSLAPLPAPSAPLPAAAPSAAVPAAVPPAPGLSGTETAVISAPDLKAGLAELRRASFEVHPQVAALVARIKARYPELPISSENLFLVRDRELLARLGIPDRAAGAARIVSDGRHETPVVILVAPRGVELDDFVEYAVHEAVHLMDDGILRVRHDQELKHFFAEGWTQKRAAAMADALLKEMGRPGTPGKAYHREIALVDAFLAAHGAAALDELVRTGSDQGLRRALGSRWDLAVRLIASEATRGRRLEALTALIAAPSVGEAERLALLDHVR